MGVAGNGGLLGPLGAELTYRQGTVDLPGDAFGLALVGLGRSQAVAVIDEVLGDANAPVTVRLKAAEVVLRRSLDEPGAQEPPVAVREPCSDPVTAMLERTLGQEPSEAILWPAPEAGTDAG